MSQRNFNLESWLYIANGFYQSACLLGNPIVSISTKINTFSSSWYLLHHSLELYLKAGLIQYNLFEKGHNIIFFAEKLSNYDSIISMELNKMVFERSVMEWIKYINSFGYPEGGIKYINKRGNGMYGAPSDIGSYFNGLIQCIKQECDSSKDISNIIGSF